MVIKTDVCSFSEQRIWPAHGTRFVRKDGTLLIFANSKMSNLYHNKKKANKLRWSLQWRRDNKKATQFEATIKKRKRTKVATLKAYSGLSLDTLKQRRNEDAEVRATRREQQAKEIKQRRKQHKANLSSKRKA